MQVTRPKNLKEGYVEQWCFPANARTDKPDGKCSAGISKRACGCTDLDITSNAQKSNAETDGDGMDGVLII